MRNNLKETGLQGSVWAAPAPGRALMAVLGSQQKVGVPQSRGCAGS